MIFDDLKTMFAEFLLLLEDILTIDKSKSKLTCYLCKNGLKQYCNMLHHQLLIERINIYNILNIQNSFQNTMFCQTSLCNIFYRFCHC